MFQSFVGLGVNLDGKRNQTYENLLLGWNNKIE